MNTTTPQRMRVPPPRFGTCTHLTMTRLYTKDFRCASCFKEGSFGWLYRCTQDRELLLEDDYEKGSVVRPLEPHLLRLS